MAFTKGKLKEIRIPTCLTESEADLIKKASEKEYMSMSSWIRKCALKSSREIIGEN